MTEQIDQTKHVAAKTRATTLVAAKHIQVLDEATWTNEETRVTNLVRAPLDRFRTQRSRGLSDPILDFLFEYYKLRPRHLEQWSPGVGAILAGKCATKFVNRRFFTQFQKQDEEQPNLVGLDIRCFPNHRHRSVQWIRDVLSATNERPPFFGCSGLHEWAMVYGHIQARHERLPFRFTRSEIDEIVRSNPVVCTHFDAFRFFADETQPMNVHQPTADGVLELEQPGCLHANMDIYRWAGKLYPWISSAILADSFLLALRIREIDMRASPYDLSQYELDPIRIETTDGKSEYRRHQQSFFLEGRILRNRLILAVDDLLARLRWESELEEA